MLNSTTFNKKTGRGKNSKEALSKKDPQQQEYPQGKRLVSNTL
jgi:polyribonucleotide nucleotidyltransferase